MQSQYVQLIIKMSACLQFVRIVINRIILSKEENKKKTIQLIHTIYHIAYVCLQAIYQWKAFDSISKMIKFDHIHSTLPAMYYKISTH